MQTPSEDLLPPAPGHGNETDIALCRAALYGALALGFRAPSAETLERIASPDAASALADAARVVASAITASASALARPGADLDDLECVYRRLFGHTARGEVPAYETEYGDEAIFQQPQELGDLAGFMRAFGLSLRPEAHERIDHVSCECEFVSFLAWKEAYAIAIGDAEMLAATTQATKLFLRDHLGRFAPAFARRLAREDTGGLYAALAAMLVAVVNADCERLGIAGGSLHLGLRPDPATVTAPMGCAAEGEGECPIREPAV